MTIDLNWIVPVAQSVGPVVTGGSAVAAAIIVSRISARQAKTAQEKLVLDLFKDRSAVLAKVEEALMPIIGAGRPEGRESFRLLHEARAQSRFLFGPEVSNFIGQLIATVARLGWATSLMEAGKVQEGADLPQVSHDSLMEVSAAPEALANLMARYMTFGQVVVPDFTERPPQPWEGLSGPLPWWTVLNPLRWRRIISRQRKRRAEKQVAAKVAS